MSKEELVSEVLENIPKGFQLEFELNPQRGTHLLDGRAKLSSPDGEHFAFAVEIKKIHRKESLIGLRHKLAQQSSELPSLLICNRLTPALAEYCISNHLNYIDSAGNARIQIPGLYILVEGKTAKKTIAAGSRFAEGVMKLLFVLLSSPDTLNETYRILAARSGISLGMVSKAFEFLEAQKYYRITRHGRRLMNTEELQALWIRDYAAALLPKLSSLSLAGPDSWHDITLTAGEYWGGEVAAAELSEGYLIPDSGKLFTPEPLPQRRMALGLKPDRKGKLQLVSCFWGNSFELNEEAKAMLCVAELLASADDRNIETARIINEKYLQLGEAAIFSY